MKKGEPQDGTKCVLRWQIAAGEIGSRWTKRLLNTYMKQCKVSEDWRTWLIVPIWKRKDDAQNQGSTEEYLC